MGKNQVNSGNFEEEDDKAMTVSYLIHLLSLLVKRKNAVNIRKSEAA